MPELVGNYLDRLASVEMRRLHEPLRGITQPITDAIRAKLGKPSSTLAATAILDSAKDGDCVLFTTGAGAPPWMPKGEVDGPPGVATMARTLYFGRGVLPIIVVAENHRENMTATLNGIGLNVLNEEMARTRYWPCAIVEVMPYETDKAKTWTRELLDHYRPKAVVASEKLGPNEKGVVHAATGVHRPFNSEVDAEHLFSEGKARGLPTISIGDVGNELGYGIVHDEVAAILSSLGRDCGHGCNAGIVSIVGCDVLLHAANSDWGAYSVAGALALLMRNVHALPPSALHLRALDACVAAGGVGQFGHQAHVGGTGPETQLNMLNIVRQIVEIALAEHHKRPF